MSKERYKLTIERENIDIGREYALLELDWLPKSDGINPLPVNFYKEEKKDFCVFAKYLCKAKGEGSVLFIPPSGLQDTYSNTSPLLDKVSVNERSYYYLRQSPEDLEDTGSWAPATVLFIPNETTIEHFTRLQLVFGARFKISPPLSPMPQEWGDRLSVLSSPPIFEKIYSQAISVRRFLELLIEIPPDNFQTYEDYFRELKLQGEYFPDLY